MGSTASGVGNGSNGHFSPKKGEERDRRLEFHGWIDWDNYKESRKPPEKVAHWVDYILEQLEDPQRQLIDLVASRAINEAHIWISKYQVKLHPHMQIQDLYTLKEKISELLDSHQQVLAGMGCGFEMKVSTP